MEFETQSHKQENDLPNQLKFTPLEFETEFVTKFLSDIFGLKFTPLEFETQPIF